MQVYAPCALKGGFFGFFGKEKRSKIGTERTSSVNQKVRVTEDQCTCAEWRRIEERKWKGRWLT